MTVHIDEMTTSVDAARGIGAAPRPRTSRQSSLAEQRARTPRGRAGRARRAPHAGGELR